MINRSTEKEYGRMWDESVFVYPNFLKYIAKNMCHLPDAP